MDILLPEFKKLLLLMVKHQVHFMLIGGYAVIYYGYERTTSDMDIWIKPTNKNKNKLIEALIEFEINEEDLKELAEKDFSQIQCFFIGKKPRRIDFLNRINGISFNDAEKEVNYFPLKKVKVPIIQYHHLILSKISNARSKDKTDVEELQKIHSHRKKEKS